MHKNIYWLSFFILISVCVLSYTGYTVFALYQYQRLTDQVPVSHIEWSTVELGEEKFAPQAAYQFFLGGRSYTKHHTWQEHYLNAWAANEAKNQLALKRWKAWVDPSHPDYSSLQKTFPIKECISAIVLWGLWSYFFFIGQYVSTYRR